MKQEPFNPMPQPTPGSTSQFTSSPLNRIGQTKQAMTMMPPPSPAQGGPPKGMKTEEGQGPGTNNPANGQPPQGTHNPDGSPRNVPPAGGGPSNGGTAPPTPVPTNRPNPQQQQPQQQSQSQPPPQPTQQTQPPQPQSNPNPMAGMMSSPLSMLGMGGSNMNLGPSDIIFDPFAGVEDFDAMNNNLFTRDTASDINFERDFGQWFNNPDDLAGGLGAD